MGSGTDEKKHTALKLEKLRFSKESRTSRLLGFVWLVSVTIYPT